MFREMIFALGCFSLTACGVGSYHDPQISLRKIEPSKAFITEKGSTLPPYGYVKFCSTNPQECPEMYHDSAATSVMYRDVTASTNQSQNFKTTLNPFDLTENLKRLVIKDSSENKRYNTVLNMLNSVNLRVNTSITQVSDIDGFGVVENWRIPDISNFMGDIGDCEDFALAKRKILIEKYGMPANNLSISVLRRPEGDVHAVLMVRTTYGDFVLDNLNDKILPWHKTGYKWIKKQSYQDPSQWSRI